MSTLLDLAVPTFSQDEYFCVDTSDALRHIQHGIDNYYEHDYNGAVIAFNKAIELDANYESASFRSCLS